MKHSSTNSVIIYTTPTCPDCRALKTWLKNKTSRSRSAI